MIDITLTLDNIATSVSGRLPKDIYEDFKKTLGYIPENALWMAKSNPYFKGYYTCVCWNREYCRCSIKKDGMHFPTGLISKARAFFTEKGINYTLIDNRDRNVINSIREVDYKLTEQLNDGLPFTLYPYQKKVIEQSIAAQRGIIKLATGGGKCLGKGTQIIMYDGTIKNVEDIIVGDKLMGPDSKLRNVLSTTKGKEKLYKIKPKRCGESFIINESHILSLKMTNGFSSKKYKDNIINMNIKDYLTQNKTFKHCAKGYRTGINFKEQLVKVDPYFIGLWLGDGTSKNTDITNNDYEIKNYLSNLAKQYNLIFVEKRYKNKCPQYAISSKGRVGENLLLNELKYLNLINNKHIPEIYKINSISNRLKVLAGLIDSDGYLHNNGYEYVTKIEKLANDVVFLARSCGFSVSINKCQKTCTNSKNKTTGIYYRIFISGNCDIIPVIIHRKKSHPRKQKKDHLVFGFSVEDIGLGDYYGFEIDGDHLFLLGDFTVTHNTVCASGIISNLGVKPTIFYVTSIDLLNQAVNEFTQYIRLNNLRITVGAIGGGNKKIADITVMTVQTAIRALDAVYEKFDDEDNDKDETDISDIKNDIVELIHSAKLVIFDECQHMAAETCQTIADNSVSARWRYGMSATPMRDKGDDILIDACFGKTIIDINASFLIQEKFLVKPHIAFLRIDNTKNERFGAYPAVYKNAIVDNVYRNNIISQLANNLKNQGRQVLILISQIEHGNILNDMIDGSIFLHGSSTKGERKNHLNLMRVGEPSITIASSIFDEGVDVKPLNSLILGGGGKSSTRALQRVGRVIRKYTYPDGKVKDTAFVYDFHDVQKYLGDHSLARRRIYQTEPMFDIQNFDLK